MLLNENLYAELVSNNPGEYYTCSDCLESLLLHTCGLRHVTSSSRSRRIARFLHQPSKGLYTFSLYHHHQMHAPLDPPGTHQTEWIRLLPSPR